MFKIDIDVNCSCQKERIFLTYIGPAYVLIISGKIFVVSFIYSDCYGNYCLAFLITLQMGLTNFI